MAPKLYEFPWLRDLEPPAFAQLDEPARGVPGQDMIGIFEEGKGTLATRADHVG